MRAVCVRAGLEIIAVGSSQLARARDVAHALGSQVKPIDDLRSLFTVPDAAAILLFAPGDFASTLSASVGDDAGLLADCRARGVPVFALEPMPSSLLQLDTPSLVPPHDDPVVAVGPDAMSNLSSLGNTAASAAGAWTSWVEFFPLLRASRPVRDAADVLPQLGAVQLAHVECWSGKAQGSLGARIFDAIDAITSIMGLPDQVDASYVPPNRPRGVAAQAATDSLRALEGHLTANMRFADGRAASVICSSRAGRFNRTLTLLGENGRLRVYDDGFAWIGLDGRTIDSARDATRIRGADLAIAPHELHAVAAIADQLTRALDPAMPDSQPSDLVRVLATAGAALLSARTRQTESPMTLMRMARTG